MNVNYHVSSPTDPMVHGLGILMNSSAGGRFLPTVQPMVPPDVPKDLADGSFDKFPDTIDVY